MTTMKRTPAAFAIVVLLLVAPSVQAQDRQLSSTIGPSAALLAGSALDLATTLHALATVPGAVEGNPLLSHGGNAGLIGVKLGTTAGLIWAIHRIDKDGHPRAAAILGYVGCAVLSGIAYRNTQVGR